MRIIINDRVIDIHEATLQLTYEEVVALGGESGTPFVKYSSKRDDVVVRSGTMNPGGFPVLLTDVMWFRITQTGSA